MNQQAQSRTRGILPLALVTVPATLAAGWLSGFLSGSGPGNAWFAALAKPAIYPPPATFGIVWSILYLLMGLALAMLLRAPAGANRGRALAAFAVQLVLNLAWSPLFFAAHRIGPALLLLGVLDVAVAVAVVLAWRVRPPAGGLLLPYMAWVLFATALNWEFLRLNPGA